MSGLILIFVAAGANYQRQINNEVKIQTDIRIETYKSTFNLIKSVDALTDAVSKVSALSEINHDRLDTQSEWGYGLARKYDSTNISHDKRIGKNEKLLMKHGLK